jgi:signal transduction histidine kinase
VYITVSDDGVGISQEKLEQVFSPLYTTKPMGQGTGLGLYVVRQILDTLYGSIEIESTINRGTTVTVTLPLATDTDLENDSGTHSGGGR